MADPRNECLEEACRNDFETPTTKLLKKNMGMMSTKQVIKEEPATLFSEFLEPDIETQDPSMTVACHCTVPQLEFI